MENTGVKVYVQCNLNLVTSKFLVTICDLVVILQQIIFQFTEHNVITFSDNFTFTKSELRCTMHILKSVILIYYCQLHHISVLNVHTRKKIFVKKNILNWH